jgi:alpha-beta hydrolase superfamily lysophospholipase
MEAVLTILSFDKIAFLESPTGAKLSWRYEPAKSFAKGVLLINHGLVEHSGRYAHFAQLMSAAGYHVYAHDHRGHGHTTATDAPIGQFAKSDGAERVVEDAKALRDFAASRHPGLPIVLFGHSMGGLIALNYAVSHPADYDALAIFNSNFKLGISALAARLVLRITQFFKGSDVPSILLPKATFETWNKQRGDGRTSADWLSHDPAQVDAYVADPLCQFQPNVSMWQDVMALSTRAPKLISRVPQTTPIMLVGGGQDPATDDGAAIDWLGKRFQTLGGRNVTVKLYPDFRHETLNELGWEHAANEFLTWADGAVEGKSAYKQLS